MSQLVLAERIVGVVVFLVLLDCPLPGLWECLRPFLSEKVGHETIRSSNCQMILLSANGFSVSAGVCILFVRFTPVPDLVVFTVLF